MIYKVEDSLRNFEPWSGAKYTFEKLSDEELDTLDSMLEDIFDYSSVETMPTATDINDLLWFENDTIAQWLGYEDWEDLERIKAGDEDLEESMKAIKGKRALKESSNKKKLNEEKWGIKDWKSAEDLYDDVRKSADDHLTDIFLEFQEKLGIKSGDIWWDDDFELDSLLTKVSEVISKVLDYQQEPLYADEVDYGDE